MPCRSGNNLVCVAIVREDGTTIDVFDANGEVRSFATSETSEKLCFSTHGHDVGSLLTPCFDENGLHGEPEEECFCGNDEPHLHAHVYDPKKCENGNKPDVTALATLTLMSITTENEENGENENVMQIPLCDIFPVECNSQELKKIKEQESGDCDCDCVLKDTAKDVKYKVKHDDHIDTLVHNSKTGQLQLEHECGSCGSIDLHGRFDLVETRSWKFLLGPKTSDRGIQVQFFEAPKHAFSLLDQMADLFCPACCRVTAIRPLEEKDVAPTSSKQDIDDQIYDAIPTIESATEQEPQSDEDVGRSSFFVEKICCASEIPAIKAIVEPLAGVKDVRINVTTKTVYVDHVLSAISGEGIATALNEERFGAHIKRDASKTISQKSQGKSQFVESTFIVEHFYTELDSLVIKEIFSKFSKSEVPSFSIHHTWGTIKVDHDPELLSATQLSQYMETAGLSINVVSDGKKDGVWTIPLVENSEEAIENQTAAVNPYVLVCGILWVVSMFSFIGGNWQYLRYVAIVSVVVGLPPIFFKAIRVLRRYQFDANCMMLFAAIGALFLQEYTEAAAVAFLFSISEWLESRATVRARNALSAIVNLRPERANLINPNTRESIMVPTASVAVGALVSVRMGDKIPCDGVVVEGTSIVDESSLTGESRPVRKVVDDKVFGGTINVGMTQLVVKTTATVDNSSVARLIRLVEEAQANRSQTETMIEEIVKRYTPLVLLIAISMCTIPWSFGKETGLFWTKNGLITIVIACPCALIISTPVTYVAGLAACAQNGLIVKGGAYLEALAQVKNIAFDKTGTLTQGRFAVIHLDLLSEKISRKTLLEYIAVAETSSSHPIATALVAAARNEGVTIDKDLKSENHTLLEGEGVMVTVNGKKVHVGNVRLFERLGLISSVSDETVMRTEQWASYGTVGYISVEEIGIVGVYCVADSVRPEAKDTIDEIKKLGIGVVMLTGDARSSALGIGKQIGISAESVVSELLPKEKLDFIADIKGGEKSGSILNPCKRRQLVLMCGDGVNDAPALATADVGVAMGEGAALSMETSDITLMDSNLDKLVYLLKMGKRVNRTILENVTFSLVAKAVVMAFAFQGKASLWAAIASDVGAMLIVTLNGMKLLPRRSKRTLLKNQLGASNEPDVEEAHLQCNDGNIKDLNKASGGHEHSSKQNKCHDQCCSHAEKDHQHSNSQSIAHVNHEHALRHKHHHHDQCCSHAEKEHQHLNDHDIIESMNTHQSMINIIEFFSLG